MACRGRVAIGSGRLPSGSRRAALRRSSSITAASATAPENPTTSTPPATRGLARGNRLRPFMPGIDPARIATFGSSLGGGNALAAAAEDPAIAAAISQVPFLDRELRPTARHRPYRPRSKRPRRRAVISPPSDSHTRPRSSTPPAPKRAGATSSRSARTRAGATAFQRDGCSARSSPTATPTPCTARGWSASPRRTTSHARSRDRRRRRAPQGEVRTYPGVDHFGIYDGPEHDAVVADEIAFLDRHVLD